MSTCRDISALLSQSVDASLGQKQRIEIRRHLVSCESCRRFQQQLKTLRVASRQYRDSVAIGGIARGAGLSRQAATRITRKIHAELGIDDQPTVASPPPAPTPRGPRIQAYIFDGQNFAGSEIVEGSRVEIGRDLSCDVVLEDDQVSRRHAAVTLFRGQLYVEDLNSSNGTTVAGQTLGARQILSARDEVGIGRHLIKFKLLSDKAREIRTAALAARPTEVVDLDADQQQELQHIADAAVVHTLPDEVSASDLHPDLVHSDATIADAAPEHMPRGPAPFTRAPSAPPMDPSGAEAANEIVPPELLAPPSAGDVHEPQAPSLDEQTSLSDPYAPVPPRSASGADLVDDLFDAPAIEPAPQPSNHAFAPVEEHDPPVEEHDPPVEEHDPPVEISPPRPLPQPASPQEDTADLAAQRHAVEAIDDEEWDPDDAPAPFSLVENLLRETFDGRHVNQSDRPVVEVIRYQGDLVEEVTALGSGQSFVVGKGLSRAASRSLGIPANHRLVLRGKGQRARLNLHRDFGGKVRTQGRSKDLAQAATWQGERAQLDLEPGDLANLRIGGDSYFVRFAYPPAVLRSISTRGRMTREGRRDRRGLLMGYVSSGAGHAAIMLMMFVASLLAPPQMATQLDEDRFVQMDVKDLELEKPPEPEPPPEEPPPEEAPVEEEAAPEPEPQKKPPKRQPRRQRLTHPSGKTRKPGILAALGKIPKRSGAAGSQTLTAAVSNLDAVKVPGGGSTYKVSGLIGKGPTRRLRVGGSGGGLATKGLASILREGGGGPGTLSKLRSGKVRGRLVKASRGSRMKGRGTLDRGEIQKVVNKGLGQIQFCYEKELLKNQSLAGKVVFEWTISPTGKVSVVKTSTSTLKSARAVQCMIGAIRKWTFPRPRGNGSVIVTYPFIFNAMGF